MAKVVTLLFLACAARTAAAAASCEVVHQFVRLGAGLRDSHAATAEHAALLSSLVTDSVAPVALIVRDASLADAAAVVQHAAHALVATILRLREAVIVSYIRTAAAAARLRVLAREHAAHAGNGSAADLLHVGACLLRALRDDSCDGEGEDSGEAGIDGIDYDDILALAAWYRDHRHLSIAAGRPPSQVASTIAARLSRVDAADVLARAGIAPDKLGLLNMIAYGDEPSDTVPASDSSSAQQESIEVLPQLEEASPPPVGEESPAPVEADAAAPIEADTAETIEQNDVHAGAVSAPVYVTVELMYNEAPPTAAAADSAGAADAQPASANDDATAPEQLTEPVHASVSADASSPPPVANTFVPMPEYADIVSAYPHIASADRLGLAMLVNGLVDGAPHPDGAVFPPREHAAAAPPASERVAVTPLLCQAPAFYISEAMDVFGFAWMRAQPVACGAVRPQPRPDYISPSSIDSLRSARMQEVEDVYSSFRSACMAANLTDEAFCSLPALPLPSADARVFLQQEAIRRAFLHAWDGYARVGLGMDTLRPHSRIGRDDLCKMGMTLVDALDTLVLAGDAPRVHAARDWAVHQLHVGGQQNINVFETTIRMIGGLLAAGDLLKDYALTLQGAQVAAALVGAGAFATPTHIPFGTVSLLQAVNWTQREGGAQFALFAANSRHNDEGPMGPGAEGPWGFAYNPLWTAGTSFFSEVASVQLEMRAASERTGVTLFHQLAWESMKALAQRTPSDGLWPMLVDPLTGVLRASTVTLGARADSGYEYMLKQWLHAGGWAGEAAWTRTELIPAVLRSVLMKRLSLALTRVKYLMQSLPMRIRVAQQDQNRVAQLRQELEPLPHALELLRQLHAWYDNIPDMRALLENVTNAPPHVSVNGSTLWRAAAAEVRDRGMPDHTAPHLSISGGRTRDVENARTVLRMYNLAVCGIMDRLLQRSTPSGFVYVAEASASVDAAVETAPTLIHKMDHLVCFLPGVLALGAAHSAGHEVLAAEAQRSLRTRAARAAAAAIMRMALESDNAAKEKDMETRNSLLQALRLMYFHSDAAKRAMRQMQGKTTYGGPESLAYDGFTNPYALAESLAADMYLTMTLPNSNFSSLHPSYQRGTLTRACNASALPYSFFANARHVDTSHPVCAVFPLLDIPKVPHSLPADGFCADTNVTRITQTLANTAHELTRTCYEMYQRTSTGLAPEIVTFVAGSDFAPNSDARHCILRPETVESLYIMHRLTGLQVYRDWAWEIFDSLERHARVRGGGYASLRDVTVPLNSAMWSAGRANQDDKMESFLLAETFKYLYLTFTDSEMPARYTDASGLEHTRPPSVLDLRSWVYNTEAHPLFIKPESLVMEEEKVSAEERAPDHTAASHAAPAQQPAERVMR